MGNNNFNMTTCFGQGEDYTSECSASSVGTTTMSEASATGFVNDAVAALAGSINLILSGGLSSAPIDLIKAALAMRCVITSGITDVWKLIMAAFYATRAFGMQSYVIQGLNSVYPQVCACKYMVQSWANMFGSGSASAAAQLGSCSGSGSSGSGSSGSGSGSP